MKRYFVFLLTIACCLSGYCQESYKVFAELLGIQSGLFSNKLKIQLDFGQSVGGWVWSREDMNLVDEDGKNIKFNSMVDAMNYMGKRGWQFEQAYVVTIGNENVYHWLMSKSVTSDEEIKEGLRNKVDAKEEAKEAEKQAKEAEKQAKEAERLKQEEQRYQNSFVSSITGLKPLTEKESKTKNCIKFTFVDRPSYRSSWTTTIEYFEGVSPAQINDIITQWKGKTDENHIYDASFVRIRNKKE